ncbi:hypothetical protein Plhal304r1_c012g0046631 [Plasmopara halstedii]
MAIKALLSPVMEDDTAYLELNDDDIIAMVQEAEGEKNDDQESKILAITASLLDVTNTTDRVVFQAHSRTAEVS